MGIAKPDPAIYAMACARWSVDYAVSNVAVVSMRAAANGGYQFNPAPATRLAEGDVLIACADADLLERFRELVARG